MPFVLSPLIAPDAGRGGPAAARPRLSLSAQLSQRMSSEGRVAVGLVVAGVRERPLLFG
jgi:hypothetical protein